MGSKTTFALKDGHGDYLSIIFWDESEFLSGHAATIYTRNIVGLSREELEKLRDALDDYLCEFCVECGYDFAELEQGCDSCVDKKVSE